MKRIALATLSILAVTSASPQVSGGASSTTSTTSNGSTVDSSTIRIVCS